MRPIRDRDEGNLYKDPATSIIGSGQAGRQGLHHQKNAKLLNIFICLLSKYASGKIGRVIPLVCDLCFA